MKLRKLITMREALEGDGYFGRLLEGDSWAAWRVLLIAIVGERLTKRERVVFKGLTGRDSEPGEPVEEFWGIIGRRGGKTNATAVLAAYLATCIDYRGILAPGERGVIPLLAASVQQAASAFDGATSDTISLKTGIDIQVRPASFRTIRGITCIAVIADEIAFWRSDDSANPDKEILKALRPSLATTGGPLICISSPHAKRGELYNMFKRHYGPGGDPLVLVAKAPSRAMNPKLSQRVIDRAVEADPEAASAEYGAEFRGDISVFVSREAIEACIAAGVTVRSPLNGVSYRAFVDPSGGSNDAMTCAIGHLDGDRAILDCILERRAPFSPDSVVAEFAETLKQYGVARVTGDRYAGEWPVERFAVAGVAYEPAPLTRSELYLAFLPLVNSGRVDLLDSPRMVSQFCGLERRTARSGRDSVDHQPDGHDDIANSVAGILVDINSDRRPALVRRDDLLVDGAPLPLPTARIIGIAAVFVTDARGMGAVVYAAVHRPGMQPGLFILDYDDTPPRSGVFARIGDRIRALAQECNAATGFVWLPERLRIQAEEQGLPSEKIPPDFRAEDEVFGVGQHLSSGSVKICGPAHERSKSSPLGGALELRSGDPVDDALRLALVTLVSLSLGSTGGGGRWVQ
jgi:hypothetical protein